MQVSPETFAYAFREAWVERKRSGVWCLILPTLVDCEGGHMLSVEKIDSERVNDVVQLILEWAGPGTLNIRLRSGARNCTIIC